MHVDECGAPERIAGVKLLPVADPGRQAHARTTSAAGRPSAATSTTSQPRVVSITQATELGTVYTLGRDSARSPTPRTSSTCTCTSTAPASPTRPPRSTLASRELTTDAGVDVVSFGGTKNGLALRRGGRLLRARARRRLRVHPQAARPARLEDALRLGPVRGPAHRRPVAAQRRARERDGQPARPPRSAGSTASRSPTRSRPTASSRACRSRPSTACWRAPRRAPVLHLGRDRRRRCAGCAPGPARRRARPAPPSWPWRSCHDDDGRPVPKAPHPGRGEAAQGTRGRAGRPGSRRRRPRRPPGH